MAGKGDDAGLPPSTLRTILGSLQSINTAAILAMRALAEEENASVESATERKAAQIDAAFAKVKVSANALNSHVGAVSSGVNKLVNDLQRLKRLYGVKRRRSR
jgi:hypothetical protein